MSIAGPHNYNVSNLLPNDLHVDGSNAMANNLNMNNKMIINLADRESNQQAATKFYCDTMSLLAESNCLSVTGANSMEADLDMNTHKIINISDPVNNQDIVSKIYIDTKYN